MVRVCKLHVTNDLGHESGNRSAAADGRTIDPLDKPKRSKKSDGKTADAQSERDLRVFPTSARAKRLKKTLSIELPVEEWRAVRTEAHRRQETIGALIRSWIAPHVAKLLPPDGSRAA